MTVFTATQFTDVRPPVVPSHGGMVVCQYAEAEVPNTLAASDIIRLGKLPPNCVPVDMKLHSDTLDTDGAIRLRLAIEDQSLASGSEDIVSSSEFTAGANPAGAVTSMTAFPAAILQDSDNLATTRHIVAKVTTVGTTKVAGTVRFWMTYRNTNFDL